MQQSFTDPRQDALVGLAGPIWGLGAALAALVLGTVTDAPYLLAIARMGALINLLNLIPIWQLDGGRAFRALGRSGRWFALLAVALAWSLSQEVVLVYILLGGVFRILTDHQTPPHSDRLALGQYVFLIAAARRPGRAAGAATVRSAGQVPRGSTRCILSTDRLEF